MGQRANRRSLPTARPSRHGAGLARGARLVGGKVSRYHVGDEVRILAPSFPPVTGTVTDTNNGLPTLTATVRTHHDGQEWVFDPTDELERIDHERIEDSGRHRELIRIALPSGPD